MEHTSPVEDVKVEEFFLENFNVDRIFRTIERADYLFLHYISACGGRSESGTGVYLSELAEAMELPIHQVSAAVKGLQDKGYVYWRMSDRKDRTYVELTPNAVELMKEEREMLRGFYDQIHEEIPKEELAGMLQTMKKVSAVIAQRVSR